MLVYKAAPVEGFEWLLSENEHDYDWLRSLDGTPRLARWMPPALYLRTIDDHGRPRRRADLPWVGAQALALRPRAVNALRAVLEQYGELLPVITRGDEPLLLFNVLRVVDALDEERSEIVRAPSSGRIMDIRRWHLREAMLEGLELFRLTGLPSVFFSDRFKARVEGAGLTGLGGRRIWPNPALN